MGVQAGTLARGEFLVLDRRRQSIECGSHALVAPPAHQRQGRPVHRPQLATSPADRSQRWRLVTNNGRQDRQEPLGDSGAHRSVIQVPDAGPRQGVSVLTLASKLRGYRKGSGCSPGPVLASAAIWAALGQRTLVAHPARSNNEISRADGSNSCRSTPCRAEAGAAWWKLCQLSPKDTTASD